MCRIQLTQPSSIEWPLFACVCVSLPVITFTTKVPPSQWWPRWGCEWFTCFGIDCAHSMLLLLLHVDMVNVVLCLCDMAFMCMWWFWVYSMLALIVTCCVYYNRFSHVVCWCSQTYVLLVWWYCNVVKKFATTTEEIRRILRLVANFADTGENNVAEGKQ